jgi:hypothetical protein
MAEAVVTNVQADAETLVIGSSGVRRE